MLHTQDMEVFLDARDLQRVQQFLDTDHRGAYEFIRATWLPDARETVERLASEGGGRNWTSLAYLCDHLREGARTIGARRLVEYAGEIEWAARLRSVELLQVKTLLAKQFIEDLARFLAGREAFR